MNQNGSNHIMPRKKKEHSYVTTLQKNLHKNQKFRNSIHITMNFELQKEASILPYNTNGSTRY